MKGQAIRLWKRYREVRTPFEAWMLAGGGQFVGSILVGAGAVAIILGLGSPTLPAWPLSVLGSVLIVSGILYAYLEYRELKQAGYLDAILSRWKDRHPDVSPDEAT